MDKLRRFPVLSNWQDRRDFPQCPESIPWALIEPHRKQAERNHGQTLERLAERGGLGPTEMYCAFHGLGWNESPMSREGAVKWLIDLRDRAISGSATKEPN